MDTTPPNNNPALQNNENGRQDNNYISVDELILAANKAINNSTHLEIAPMLLKRGYTPLDMAAAKQLINNLQNLDEKQKKEYSEQYQATKTYKDDWNDLNIIYAEHVELGRIVFKNDLQNYVQLGLNGNRKRSFSGFIQLAKQFYNNALKTQNAMDELSKKGISKKELEDTQALIEKVEKEKFAQSIETGEAQQATKDRDDAFDTLNEWYSDFKKVAYRVFLSKPQLLKILGL